MRTMSLEDHQEAIALAKQLPNHVQAIRDSFHSLIGDFWVKGFVHDKIKSASKDIGHSPILTLWDAEVPVPNPHTALAWLLTCEFDPLAARARIIVPESVDPFSCNNQMEGYESTIRTSPMAYEIRNLRSRLSPEFISQFNKSNRGGPAAVYTISRGKHKLAGLQERLPRETDDLRLTTEEIRAITIRRAALLRQVLTPPLSPTSQDAYWNSGFNIRSWSVHGLSVITPKTVEHRFTSAGERIHIPAIDIPDSSIAKVPSVTQPLWFGFTKATTKGATAAEVWLSHYMEHRSHALELLESGDPIQVMNPEWQSELSLAGKLNRGLNKGRNKTNTASGATAMMMAGLMTSIKL